MNIINHMLRGRDVGYAIVLSAIVTGLSFGLWSVANTKVAIFSTIFTIVLVGSVGSLALYRRYLAALDQRQVSGASIGRSVDNCYRQLEALTNVRAELALTRALPAMRGWAISPDFAELIVTVLKSRSPDTILECGSGVSTLVIGHFLKCQGSGRLISLEHDEEYAKESLELLREHELDKYATVIHAPLMSYECEVGEVRWYDTSCLDSGIKFDSVVVDGPPASVGSMARLPLLYVAGKYLGKNCIVLLDDANRQDEKNVVEKWAIRNPTIRIRHINTEKGAVSLVVP